MRIRVIEFWVIECKKCKHWDTFLSHCNSAGDITHYTEIVLDFQGYREKVVAEITDLGWHQMILRYIWLKHHNPDIDWETGQVKMTRCPWTCRVLQGKSPLEQSINVLDQNSLRTIHAIKKEQERLEVPKPNLRPKDLVPKAYHKYLKVFSRRNPNACQSTNHKTMLLKWRIPLYLRKED